jgi:hypothetical protein
MGTLSNVEQIMPQLDKLSFATQYFWLTLFFFGLYFLTVNFFVILVFKNLKLRNIIYKIWYFFLYKFDYLDYENKNKKLIQVNFAETYSLSYFSIYLTVLRTKIFNKVEALLNKNLILNFSNNLTQETYMQNFIIGNSFNNNLLNNLNNLNIDEI